MLESPELLNKAQAIGVMVAFVAVAAANALVSSGISVPLTNVDIANSHPVYMTPAGYAFSVWGVIYLFVAIFSVLQCLPSEWNNPSWVKIRPMVIFSMVTNVAWLYTFSWQYYWVSFVIIIAYAASLIACLVALDVEYLNSKHPWRLKLASTAFSANAAWVCVASSLQPCLNLLDEGFLVSPDGTTGILFAVTLFACYNVFRRCDFMYAAVSAWALGGIISNQGKSNFGTSTTVCSEECMAHMNPCQPGGIFYVECMSAVNATMGNMGDIALVEKSAKVACFAWVCMGLVGATLVAACAQQLYYKANNQEHGTREPLAPDVTSSINEEDQ